MNRRAASHGTGHARPESNQGSCEGAILQSPMGEGGSRHIISPGKNKTGGQLIFGQLGKGRHYAVLIPELAPVPGPLPQASSFWRGRERVRLVLGQRFNAHGT